MSETTDAAATGASADPSEPARDDDVGPPPSGPTDRSTIDLASVAADLDGVEAALRRLDDGTYWSDEITGDPIPDDVLAARPVARRTDGS